MSSLRECARSVLDTARNGVGWILLFKQGRAWNVSEIYPDIDDIDNGVLILDADELIKVEHAISVDGDAVLLNSYIHSLGINNTITVEILEHKLKWQYQTGKPLASGWSFSLRNEENRIHGSHDSCPQHLRSNVFGQVCRSDSQSNHITVHDNKAKEGKTVKSKLIWEKVRVDIGPEGTTITYRAKGTNLSIESRKRHIPHANGIGTWDCTRFYVMADGIKIAEKYLLRTAKEYAELVYEDQQKAGGDK